MMDISKRRFKIFLLALAGVALFLFILLNIVQGYREYLKTYREVTVEVIDKEHEYEPEVWGYDPVDGEYGIQEFEVNNFWIDTDIARFGVGNEETFNYFEDGKEYCVGIRGFEGNTPDLVKILGQGPCIADIKERKRR